MAHTKPCVEVEPSWNAELDLGIRMTPPNEPAIVGTTGGKQGAPDEEAFQTSSPAAPPSLVHCMDNITPLAGTDDT